MTDAPFERYKDALKRGHLAALRHKLDEALAAYDEAAELAPDRSLPLTSRGTVLARMGRPEDALGSFERALERSARDEGALIGRAEALATLGRRSDAASAFDEVADLHDQAGRLTVASEAARRALELVESRHRRDLVTEYVDRLAAAPQDERAKRELERARALLVVEEGPSEPEVPPAQPDDAGVALDGLEPPVPAEARPAGSPPPPPVDVVALARRADEAIDLGDTASAREALLELAEAHRAAGRIDAALDAGYLALSIAPGNVDLHVALVGLYLERGWRAPAVEKLRLLGKLVELADDPNAARRFEALVAERFGDVGVGAPLGG